MNATESRTLLDYLTLASDFLRDRGIESHRLNAELLLCDAIGLRRIDLYLQFDRPLGPNETDVYREHLARRAKGEPLQYILGVAEFYGRQFVVNPHVLIPRPETEILVETAIDSLTKADAADAAPLVADIGTGSGCIALTIAAEIAAARVVATDLSADALSVARANADSMDLASRVEFRAGDMLEPLAGQRVDAIVSNPPYVADSDREKLQIEVRDHEPEAALYAGPDGLHATRRLIDASPAHLEPGGFVALEVGLGHSDAVRALWRERAPDWVVTTVRDLAGVERIVVASRPA